MFNLVDNQYHGLLARLVAKIGNERDDRTGTGTVSVFGPQMRFDLNDRFPILTTKKVHFKSIAVELNWFLRGDTNIKYLLERGVHIWTDWRYKQYRNSHTDTTQPIYDEKAFEKAIIESDSFAKDWGDIGKGYGHQWRNFGKVGEVIGTSYQLREHVHQYGFDQLAWVINEIKTNPTSRRLIVSGWNPHEVSKVDLPPCHTLFQFYVEDDKLSCQLYQRSADIFLGVPFNIASYALLTHIVAQECGLKLGEFVWTGGDVHLYSNHYEQAKLQLSRESTACNPQLFIPHPKPFDQYEWDDFLLASYFPHDAIKAPVAV